MQARINSARVQLYLVRASRSKAAWMSGATLQAMIGSGAIFLSGLSISSNGIRERIGFPLSINIAEIYCNNWNLISKV